MPALIHIFGKEIESTSDYGRYSVPFTNQYKIKTFHNDTTKEI
jgi:hypothetical protein